MFSVVILTKNEEKNIKECLETVGWADEILVIDDNSTDKTPEIVSSFAKAMEDKQSSKLKVKIYERDLNGDFASQRNFGLEKAGGPARNASQSDAGGDWVLFVDADERVTPKLRDEIKRIVDYKYAAGNGFYLKREDVMWGKVLRHGETANVRLLRLGRKDAGKWERRVDEFWNIEGEISELENSLLHYPHQTMTEFLESINYFSTLNARAFYDEGKKTTLKDWFKPPAKFIQNWILRGGFFDGMPGFAVALLMSFHSFLVRAKLYLLWKQGVEWK